MKKRSGTQFIQKAKCGCKSQRIILIEGDVVVVCPHYKPYNVKQRLG